MLTLPPIINFVIFFKFAFLCLFPYNLYRQPHVPVFYMQAVLMFSFPCCVQVEDEVGEIAMVIVQNKIDLIDDAVVQP